MNSKKKIGEFVFLEKSTPRKFTEPMILRLLVHNFGGYITHTTVAV